MLDPDTRAGSSASEGEVMEAGEEVAVEVVMEVGEVEDALKPTPTRSAEDKTLMLP